MLSFQFQKSEISFAPHRLAFFEAPKGPEQQVQNTETAEAKLEAVKLKLARINFIADRENAKFNTKPVEAQQKAMTLLATREVGLGAQYPTVEDYQNKATPEDRLAVETKMQEYRALLGSQLRQPRPADAVQVAASPAPAEAKPGS